MQGDRHVTSARGNERWRTGGVVQGVSTRGRSVDVGVPTWGRPQYLRETIESVLAQTFQRWRLTVSENGPGDEEIRAIVEPYLADPRVRHVPTGSEISAPENATRAVDAGEAPFVALLHDDDRWAPEFLARRVAFLESNRSCGLVFSHCNFINPVGALVFRRRVPLDEGVQPRDAFVRVLYHKNIIVMPTVLARRSAYDLVGSAFSTSLLFDDWEMWMRISARCDVGFLDVYDAFYRIHPRQMTHPEQARLGEHRLELLDAIDGWLSQDVPPDRASPGTLGGTPSGVVRRIAAGGATDCGGPSPRRLPGSSGRSAGSQDGVDGNPRVEEATGARATLVEAIGNGKRSLMAPVGSQPNTSNLRAGDLVEVRSESEILATLDEHGRLDGLPFMPEMLRFCGKRFQVQSRAHKTCDTGRAAGFRRLENAVHLKELRCDGSSHGGCQASCLLFWKEDWLRPVATSSARDGRSVPAGHLDDAVSPAGRCTPGGARGGNARADDRQRRGDVFMSGNGALGGDLVAALVGRSPVRRGSGVRERQRAAARQGLARRAAEQVPGREQALSAEADPDPRGEAVPVRRGHPGRARRRTVAR